MFSEGDRVRVANGHEWEGAVGTIAQPPKEIRAVSPGWEHGMQQQPGSVRPSYWVVFDTPIPDQMIPGNRIPEGTVGERYLECLTT